MELDRYDRRILEVLQNVPCGDTLAMRRNTRIAQSLAITSESKSRPDAATGICVLTIKPPQLSNNLPNHLSIVIFYVITIRSLAVRPFYRCPAAPESKRHG